MRDSFLSKVASQFKELLDFTENLKTDWDLFTSVVITSAAASCGYKHLGGQMVSEKKNAWWNQKVIEAISAEKAAFKAWLTDKSSEQVQLQYSIAHKTAITIVKQSNKMS